MRTRLRLFALTIAATAGGCTMVRMPQRPTLPPTSSASTTPEPWHETYGGSADLQGQKLLVLLELSGAGDSSVTATLRIDEIGLRAEGSGNRHDGALDLRLAYAGNCPGRLHLTAAPGEGEGALVGTLEAEDCTGTEQGTVRLLRRSADGLW